MSQPEVAFLGGEFCPVADARISIRSRALNYGLGCFEGIRGYWNSNDRELYVFRPEEHFQRLQDSCKTLHLQLPYSVDDLVRMTIELCRRNSHREDIYIRPIVFNNSEALSPMLTEESNEFAMYTLPLQDYLDTSKGLRVCVSSWRRVSDNMIPARAKPTGAYLNSALARYEAEANGYDEAILLTQSGYVSEASAEHVFLVRDGGLITPGAQEDNLEGITRRTILEIAPAELGREAVARRINRTELYVADEAFLCGTGAQIAPVVEIDCRPVGDGKIGPVTRELQELYFNVIRANVPKYSHWCRPVYSEK